MSFYLLDVVDAGVTSSGNLGKAGILLASTVLLEAIVMLLMKYHRLGKALLHSAIVNVASLAAGFVLIKISPGLFQLNALPNLLFLFIATVIIEFPGLYFLNRDMALEKTLLVTTVMNLGSYGLFYFLQSFLG